MALLLLLGGPGRGICQGEDSPPTVDDPVVAAEGASESADATVPSEEAGEEEGRDEETGSSVVEVERDPSPDGDGGVDEPTAIDLLEAVNQESPMEGDAGPAMSGEAGPIPESDDIESGNPAPVPLPPGEGGEGAANGNGLLTAINAGAGPGVIEGEVFDEESGEGLPGAFVSVPALDFRVRTDDEGRYSIKGLPLGPNLLKFTKSGYVSAESEIEVATADTPVTASKGLAVRPVELDDSEYLLEEYEFVAEYTEEDEAVISFDNVSEGLTLQSSIGRDEFTKKNLSTAGDAVAKISGANVVDGKRPVIRGLADRYITTTVNGGVVASTQPLRKAVELDLFPTSVIEDIKVNKVYNATLPGDFGGAAIEILTRAIPDERIIELKLGTGSNSIDAEGDFYVSRAPSLSFWGGADFPNYREILQLEDGDLYTNPARAAERAALWGDAVSTHDFLPGRTDHEADLDFSMLIGDSWEVGHGKLGVIYTLSRSTEDRAILGGFTNNGSAGIYDYDEFNREVDWAQMLSLAWQINESNELKATYFKKHIGSGEARHITNWEDNGEFEISKGVVLQGGLYQSYARAPEFLDAGGNPVPGMFEIIGGDFWGVQLAENSLEITQFAGRHKFLGHGLEDEAGPLLEWGYTRSENSILLDTSVARRIEVSYDTPALRELAAGTMVDPGDFVIDPAYGETAQTIANGNFRKPRFGSDPDRPLTTSQINGISTWQDLEDLLVAAGVSSSALATYNSELSSAIAVVEAPRTDFHPERGTKFSNYNGITPNQLKSFKETYPQFEQTENFTADVSLPINLGNDYDRRFTLRTGLSHEHRLRSERSIEVEVDNGTYQEAGFEIGENPSQGYSDVFTGFTNGSVPFLNPIDTTNVSAARNIDVEQTITGYYFDGELQAGDMILRGGARHEEVDKFFDLIGLGSSSRTSSADSLGFSASYAFPNDLRLLAGLSSTVARPVIKEQLPINQVDRSTGQSFTGNQFLEDTAVQSADFSMIFPEFKGITSSLTLFHKSLEDPIIYIDTSGDIDIINGDTGTIKGLELEAGLDLPGPFSVDANYAFIQGDLRYNPKIAPTDPDVNLTSTFPEQPSQVINLSLNYADEDRLLNANLSYNYVSEYVVTLPRSAIGAFQVKQPSPKLDLTVTKKFEAGESEFTAGFSVKNILDSSEEVWNEGYAAGNFQGVRSSYDKGRTFGLWIKGTF